MNIVAHQNETLDAIIEKYDRKHSKAILKSLKCFIQIIYQSQIKARAKENKDKII